MSVQKQISSTVALVNQFESYAKKEDITIEAVSKGSLYWHIDHTIKVINAIYKVLTDADPTTYKKEYNLSKIAVYALGKMPRGKGKSPKVVLPDPNISVVDRARYINKAKSNLEALAGLDPNVYFKHPFFGNLNLKDSIIFLEMHTKHHQKIIEDILEKTR